MAVKRPFLQGMDTNKISEVCSKGTWSEIPEGFWKKARNYDSLKNKNGESKREDIFCQRQTFYTLNDVDIQNVYSAIYSSVSKVHVHWENTVRLCQC